MSSGLGGVLCSVVFSYPVMSISSCLVLFRLSVVLSLLSLCSGLGCVLGCVMFSCLGFMLPCVLYLSVVIISCLLIRHCCPL